VALACLWLAGPALAEPPLPAGAEPSPRAREEWMKGYVKLEEARKVEAAGRHAAAADLYAGALEVFRRVQERYPEWNAALLRYRIQYCAERVATLRQQVAETARPASADDLRKQSEAQAQDIRQKDEEIRDLRRQLELAGEAVERARREAARNAAASEETQTLVKENQALATRLQAFEQRVAALQAENEGLRADASLAQTVEQLKAQVEVGAARRAEAEAELAKAREALAQAQEQLRQAAVQREALKGEAAAAATTAEAARTQLDERDRQLRERSDALDVASRARRSAEDELAAVRARLEQVSQAEARSRQDAQAAAEARAKATALAEELLAARGRVAALEAEVAQAREKAVPQPPTAEPAGPTLEELTAKVAALEKEREALAAVARTNAELAATLKTREDELRAARETAGRQQNATTDQDRRIARLTFENEELRRGALETRAALDTARDSEKRLLDRSRGMDAELAQAQAALEQSRTAARQAAEDAAAARQEREQTSERLLSQLALLQKQEQEIGRLDGENRQMRQQIANLTAAAPVPAAAEEEMATLRKRVQDAMTGEEYQRQRSADLERRLAASEAAVESLRAELRGGAAAAGGGEAEGVAVLRAQLEQDREQIRRLEARLAEQTGETAPPTAASAQPAAAAPVDAAALVPGLLRKGMTAEKEGNLEAAAWNYKAALEHDANSKLALQRLGAIALQHGDSAAAEGYLRTAFYRDPDDLDTLLPLGYALIRQEKPDLAVSTLARAVAMDETNPTVHRHLGVACSSIGWREAAEVQFRRALALDGKDAESAFNLAMLVAAKPGGDKAEARRWYKLARENGVEGDAELDKHFGYAAP